VTLFVDGDAFPNLLKPILLRAIERLSLSTRVIANKRITIGRSSHIEYILVEQGADEADHRIVEEVKAGDLVITADIPLADRVIARDAHAIDHRGELYTVENIKQYLAMRNLMEQIRDTGEITGGPKPFGQKDAHAFANQLNAFLEKHRGA
jgi:uncharacterized protein YaiI (UPF0178 family)